MIEELRIQGYRSLRDVTWRPGKLNVLIGPNGGGKSNLLRSLQLLQAAAQGNLSDVIIRQGGMAPILWNEEAEEVHLTIRSAIFSYSERGVTPTENLLTYDLGLRRVGKSGDFVVDVESLTDSSGQSLMERSMGLEFLGSRDTVIAQGVRLMGPLHHPNAFRASLVLSRIHHDMRADQKAEVRQSAVARQESYVADDGQNLVTLLSNLYQRNDEFQNDIDRAMGAAFIDDYEKLVFPPEAQGRIELHIRRKKTKRLDPASLLSDGTLRFLMLAAILCNPEPPSLIAIDEPELGLHPRMLSIVAELATSASDRTQVVLSTHSEQLLNCFKEEIPTTTVVTWDGKETHLNSFSADQLKDWLAEFSLGEFSFSGTAEALG